MTIVDDTLHGQSCPIGAPHALGIPICAPGQHEWFKETYQHRWGAGERWMCLRCGVGAAPEETLAMRLDECAEMGALLHVRGRGRSDAAPS